MKVVSLTNLIKKRGFIRKFVIPELPSILLKFKSKEWPRWKLNAFPHEWINRILYMIKLISFFIHFCQREFLIIHLHVSNVDFLSLYEKIFSENVIYFHFSDFVRNKIPIYFATKIKYPYLCIAILICRTLFQDFQYFLLYSC